MLARALLILLGSVVGSLTGCTRNPAAAPAAAPLVQEKPRVESELTRTTLTKEQSASLQIKTALPRSVDVQQTLTRSGYIIARPGEEVILTAPQAGYVRYTTDRNAFPVQGSPVKEGTEVLRIEPVLGPTERVQFQNTQLQLLTLRRQLEGDRTKAQDNLELARKNLDRTRQLVRDRIQGEAVVEQADNQLKLAAADLAAADDKLKLFDKNVGLDITPAPIPVVVPISGQVLTVHATPGQFVAATAPLVTVANLHRPWIRLPIFEQDLHWIQPREPATVSFSPAGAKSYQATWHGLVGQIDLIRHTADVLYDLGPAFDKAPSGQLPVVAKDLLVTVHVPIGKQARETVLPSAAIVYDTYGGAWVYVDVTPIKQREEQHALLTFERRRAELGPLHGDGQVIRAGLTDRDHVVVDGAATLFSREFYKPPAPAPAKH